MMPLPLRTATGDTQILQHQESRQWGHPRRIILSGPAAWTAMTSLSFIDDHNIASRQGPSRGGANKGRH
jgi:hypothetical protein